MRTIIATICIVIIASYGVFRENTNKDKDLAWAVNGVKKVIHVHPVGHGRA